MITCLCKISVARAPLHTHPLGVINRLPMRNRTPLLVLAATTLLALGCSVESGATGEHTGTGRQAVIKGTASDSSQDAVVLLVMYDKATGEFGECTGTLLAPN